jgi:hypothetical protein
MGPLSDIWLAGQPRKMHATVLQLPAAAESLATCCAETTDTVTSYHRAAGLNPVSAIEVYQAAGSTNIDGLVIKYSSGQFDTVGSPDATEVGQLLASVAIPAADTIQSLYLWTSGPAVQGILLKTSSGAQLRANQGRQPTLATASWTAESGSLGSGLLLGVTAAVRPRTAGLAALSFNLLQAPSSYATAVDMPTIDMNSLKYTPVAVLKSSIGLSGGAATATCPEFSATVVKRVSYSKLTSIQRLQQLLGVLGTPVEGSQQTLQLDAALQWAGDRSLPSGEARTELWTSQVGGGCRRARAHLFVLAASLCNAPVRAA